MKRDNDYIRQLLFEMEGAEDFCFDAADGVPEEHLDKRLYHLKLLMDAGFVTYAGKYTHRLTNSGHDLLEALRDEGIWQKTKAAVAETGGSATLDIIKQVAIGFIKKQLHERTGFEF